MKAKIQWCESEKMKLQSLTRNEKIIVSGNKFLNKKLPLFGAMFPLTGIMIFSTNNIISKNIGIGIGIGIGILMLLLVGLIGTLTIGKNKWLKLKKE